MMEVEMTTGAVRRAKLQLNCHHHQTYTQLSTGQMPFLSPNQQCQSYYCYTVCTQMMTLMLGVP